MKKLLKLYWLIFATVCGNTCIAEQPQIAPGDAITQSDLVAKRDMELREIDTRVAELSARAEFLESEIAKIDSEMARCKKQNTAWKAATIVGGIGTVGSAIGITTQLVKKNQTEKATNKTEPENKK